MRRTLIITIASAAFVVAACGGSAATSAPATPAPATPAPTMASSAPASQTPSGSPAASPAADLKDIVDTATAAGSFTTLLTAAKEAGLVDTLKGDGPFTVFAPTDAAFAALPKGTLDGLLADKEALKKVLLYHVVSGDVTADQVVKLTSADTVEGEPISIKVVDGGVVLNDKVKVTTTDIQTTNGVIHVIDGVLLPPA
jgi:uncharacterized surface protein with fasciclin (FAS1) repeats